MDNKVKSLAILGSTGSVGRQTLDLVRSFPQEFSVVGLGAGSNLELLAQQAEEFHPKVVSCQNPEEVSASRLPTECQMVSQEEVASHPEVDMVVAASVGKAGLSPIMAALEAGKDVALANKEPVVMAGDMVMAEARRNGGNILPVDSEPSAIWQCLSGEDKEVSRVIITASGGPFRKRPAKDLPTVTPEEALQHPTWQMGKKITIDSATLMNKGFEVIEAHWLFDLPWEKIEVVVHPQSIIHSMVEFADGSVKAQLSPPDMRLPIQYAFSYPDRWETGLPTLDLAACGPLEFDRPDTERFPCLSLAYRALGGGAALPAVLNAANEVAVEAFLDEVIPFTAIPVVIEQALDDVESRGGEPPATLDDVRSVDARTREFSRALVSELQSRR